MRLWSLFPLPSADKAPCVSHPLSLVLRIHSRGLHAAESPRNLLNIHSQGSPYPCSTQSGVLQLGQQYIPLETSERTTGLADPLPVGLTVPLSLDKGREDARLASQQLAALVQTTGSFFSFLCVGWGCV